jgi:hypothetical protein
LGEKVALKLTPMVGGVFGNTTGVAPGYLAGISWKQLELSTEGEFVFDKRNSGGSFFYSWTELSYSPRDWCRSLDIQRGILIGFSHKKLGFTTYIFNAGWTDPTVVLSLGLNS